MNYNQTLYGALHESALKFPERNALLFMNKYISYYELDEKICTLASGFLGLGLQSGDVVTLAMPNVFEAIFSFYALNKIGVVCHMVHPLTPVIQMSKFMKQNNSKFIIILDTFYGHFQKLYEEEKTFILVTPVDEFGSLKQFGYRLLNRKKLKAIPKSDRILYIRDLYCWDEIKIDEIEPKKTAFLLHSGGTSGEPKTIELSNYAISYLSSQTEYILGDSNFENQHMLAILPMFHGFGLCMGIHSMLMFGGVDTLMPKFSSDEAVKLISKNQINYIIGVPSLFESLLRHEHFRSPKVVNIRQAFVGGDYVAQDLKDRFNEVMKYYYSKARLLEGYGLTEVVTVCSVNTLNDSKDGTVGKPLPGMVMNVVDSTTNAFLEPNQSGEIVVSGPTMMNGYRNDKEATDQTIVNINGQLWVKTGDLGMMDEEGYAVFKQRLKRIIKVSGIPVLPSEIENLLMSKEEVLEVAAIGKPDDLKGSKVKLFIVFVPGKQPLSNEAICKLIRENLGRYAEPSEIVVLESLPKTIIGKTNVLELEQL